MINKNIILKSIDDAIHKCSRYETFNEDDYSMETLGLNGTAFYSEEKGEYELEQEVLQDKSYGDGVYSDRDVTIMEAWSNGICEYLTKYMNGEYYEDECPTVSFYDDYDNEEEVGVEGQINAIHRVIKNSPRLFENMVLYRGGEWEEGLEAGDTGVFEAFTSTSFQKNIANNFNSDDRYMIKIYAPKDTKGVLVNEDFDNHGQHEWLLDKGQKYVVINQDDENREVEILLLRK